MTRKGRYLRLGSDTKNLVTIEKDLSGRNLRVLVQRGVLEPFAVTHKRTGYQWARMTIDQSGCIWLRFTSDDEYIEFIEYFTPLKFIKWESYDKDAEAIFVEPDSLKVGKLNELMWDIEDDYKGDD